MESPKSRGTAARSPQQGAKVNTTVAHSMRLRPKSSIEATGNRRRATDKPGVRAIRSATGLRIVVEGASGPMRLISVDGTVRE